MLLANHPLDCPVCDKGGECPLQDQAFSHGPGESRFVEEKRHYEKPIPISDLVFLDRERCILCDRCTRFADEVAGDKLIHFTSRGNNTQVMTFPDEPFASYFSGNTVQICPVGALTAKPYRFKARPWDLSRAGDHLHHVLGRLPHRHPVEPRRSAAAAGRRQRSGQLGLAVRPRPVQLRVRQVRRAPRPSRSSAASPASRPPRGTPRSMPLVGSSARRSTPAVRLGHRRARWRPRVERGRVRLGAARRCARRRVPRRPVRRRAPGRGARAAAGDHRRRGRRLHDHPARPGPERGTARAVPPAARRRREEGHQDRRVHVGRVRAVEVRLEVGALRTGHLEHRDLERVGATPRSPSSWRADPSSS